MRGCALQGVIFAAALLTFSSGALGQASEQPAEALLRNSAIAHITTYVEVNAETHEEHRLGQGSGFLVSPDGKIITAKHVLMKDLERFPGKRRFEVKLGRLGMSPMVAQVMGACAPGTTDLCILRVPRADVQAVGTAGAFRLLCIEPPINTPIVSFGFFPGASATVNQTPGLITGEIATELKFPSNVQITQGMSGGPILFEGYAIGVNVGALEAGGNLAFIEALNAGDSMIRDAGLTCLDGIPSASAPMAEQPAAEVDASEDTPADIGSLQDNSANTLQPERRGMNLAAQPAVDLADAPGPCGVAPRSFSVKVGPDKPPSSFEQSKEIKTDDGCNLGTYKLNIGGNAEVESFNVENMDNLKGLRLNYALRSTETEERTFKVSLTLIQQMPSPARRDRRAEILARLSSVDLAEAPRDYVIRLLEEARRELARAGETDLPTALEDPPSMGEVMQHRLDVEDILGGGNSFPRLPDLPDAFWDRHRFSQTEIGEVGRRRDRLIEIMARPELVPECATKGIVLDRTLPPLAGKAQSGRFIERVEADAGCLVVGVAFLPPDIAAPEQTYSGQPTDDGEAAILSYAFSSSDVDVGRLSVKAKILQVPSSPVVLASSDPKPEDRIKPFFEPDDLFGVGGSEPPAVGDFGIGFGGF